MDMGKVRGGQEPGGPSGWRSRGAAHSSAGSCRHAGDVPAELPHSLGAPSPCWALPWAWSQWMWVEAAKGRPSWSTFQPSSSRARPCPQCGQRGGLRGASRRNEPFPNPSASVYLFSGQVRPRLLSPPLRAPCLGLSTKRRPLPSLGAHPGCSAQSLEPLPPGFASSPASSLPPSHLCRGHQGQRQSRPVPCVSVSPQRAPATPPARQFPLRYSSFAHSQSLRHHAGLIICCSPS